MKGHLRELHEDKGSQMKWEMWNHDHTVTMVLPGGAQTKSCLILTVFSAIIWAGRQTAQRNETTPSFIGDDTQTQTNYEGVVSLWMRSWKKCAPVCRYVYMCVYVLFKHHYDSRYCSLLLSSCSALWTKYQKNDDAHPPLTLITSITSADCHQQ